MTPEERQKRIAWYKAQMEQAKLRIRRLTDEWVRAHGQTIMEGDVGREVRELNLTYMACWEKLQALEETQR